MSDEEAGTVLPVLLDNGSTIHVEVRDLNGREKVSDLKNLSLKTVMDAVEGVSGEMAAMLKRLKPQKAAIEMGFEISAESGQLTALLVKGSGKATFKVTLEWSGDGKSSG